MNIVQRFFWLLLLLSSSVLSAQTDDYSGLRVALFQFQVISAKPNNALIKCRFANTGRLPIGTSKNAAAVVVELDTINLPPILWGHEAVISRAALQNLPVLRPGEISSNIWLNIEPDAVEAVPSAATCHDFKIDTAFIRRLDKEKILLSAIVLNNGTVAASLDGKEAGTGINLYFVSGKKLTRGAIPAGSYQISVGKESLTGWLLPGQKMQVDLEADLARQTKFSPNLLLELAIPSTIQDCLPANNTHVLSTTWLEKGM